MKKRISTTLDEEIIEWLDKKTNQEHLGISTFLNQLLWKVLKQ